MNLDAILKIIKALKPNQCYLIGGLLVSSGLAGVSLPYWFPLIEDIIRNSLNIATKTEVYNANPVSVALSVLSIILGSILIVINRYIEHKEQIEFSKNNIIEFKKKQKSAAFEASHGSSITINRSKIKNYSKVAKANDNSSIELNDTDVENK